MQFKEDFDGNTTGIDEKKDGRNARKDAKSAYLRIMNTGSKQFRIKNRVRLLSLILSEH